MIKSLNNKKKTKFYIIICILVIHYFLPSIMSSTYIKMIYVGQGDSILLHSKNDSILIDTGGVPSFKKENWQKQNKENSIVKSSTIPLLKSLGIKKIKHLIITHGDFDHIGEAYNLIKYFKVENIIINNNKINYLEEKLIKEFKNVTIGEEGLVLKCGDIKLVQLNENLNDENDSSQIYYASYKNKSILFTGDASIKSEELLLKTYDLGNAHSAYEYPKGKVVKAYLSNGKLYANEEGVKTSTPIATIYFVFLFGSFGMLMFAATQTSKISQKMKEEKEQAKVEEKAEERVEDKKED